MTDRPTDYTILDQIIVGRVKPHIYAFATNTHPNFIKVGDTYRPVATRLREWRQHFPDLTKEYEERATVGDDVYFRDFAVHQFLESKLGKARLTREELQPGAYYSREFFASTSADDVEGAITDIREGYVSKSGIYDYYDASRLPVEHRYIRGPEWTLRPNQKAAVDRFVQAVDNGRTNLLMYAVMRFGKSFTSLCCAKAMNAQTVLIVSAKADVRTEWKKTVETAGNFDGYVFLDSDSLAEDAEAIQNTLASSQSAVVFLTLQDLQGPLIKNKHAELFGQQIDLLIVDESHFGARAGEYGKILKEAGQPLDDARALARCDDDRVDTADADEQLKALDTRIRLHLSGTPYRILMGSEFSSEDVIAFVQFSDIAQDQERWDRENLDRDDVSEWDNPYFGFPQMVRFAFHPSEAARRKMETLRLTGASLALSALLEPKSIKHDKTSGLHKQFKHEPEVLDLLLTIDGSRDDDSLLGFLDYDRIKEGMMCRHAVMVLPYCASCDAMEALIESHCSEFKNLAQYQIINISGVEGSKRYKSPEQVKEAIREAEDRGIKTLTLTVNRMLTGSTVEQWDTMLFLKDTSSPQEYDQAIFRLQNQHIRTLRPDDKDDPIGVIRENLKPQTLLVDFAPGRLFRMQEQKSLIYNANTEKSGNNNLEERIGEELRISPIITMNLGQIVRVEAASILDAISQYSSQRSIADEAREIPVDLGVLENVAIRRVIEAQAELGSKAGLTMNPVEGDGTELDVPDPPQDDNTTPGGDEPPDDGAAGDETSGDDAARRLARRLQTYYQRILFFAMLTPDNVRSLADIVQVVEQGDNRRIARHLALEPDILRALLAAFDPFKLGSLDYKIQNISQLLRDDKLEPIERATRALNKFTRISGSEVRTPSWLCHDMVAQIPEDRLLAAVDRGEVILDVASKSGEFALAMYQRLVDLGVKPEAIQGLLYALPTSGIAYEFTRRFYEILGLDVTHIARQFTAYEVVDQDPMAWGLLTNKSVAWDELAFDLQPTKGSSQMKFSVVVGNPPYQEADNEGGKGSARPLYHQFVDLAMSLSPEFISMVTPSVWFSGGKGLDEFRNKMMQDERWEAIHHFSTAQDVFPQVELRGGVSYFLWNRDYDNLANGMLSSTTQDGVTITKGRRKPRVGNLEYFIVDSVAAALVERLIKEHHIVLDSESEQMLSSNVSPRNPYAFSTTFAKEQHFRPNPKGLKKPVKLYASKGRVGYVERTLVVKNSKWIDRWKVLTPFANNIGTSRPDDNMNTLVGEPGSISTETYLVLGADLNLSKADCLNLEKYLQTRFLRFLVSLAKANQNGTRKTFSLVPMQDFSATSDIDWTASVDCIDDQLFDKYKILDDERRHIRLVIKEMMTSATR